jgi:hypothetical protein
MQFKTKTKEKFPLLFLLLISIWWAFYYQSNSVLNEFGAANFEWLYLIDGLLVLPVICFICIKNKKQAALKALVYCCLVILIGSFIIPDSNKFIWNYLESGRYLVLAVFIVFELIAMSTVYFAISSALNKDQDPDLAISEPIGVGVLAKLLNFETRMWSFALFSQRIKQENYKGDHHFSYHQKDGAQSNLLGFIIIILFELPLAHLLLHFIWSPMAANIISGLTAFSLVFFIAEYRAVSRRPISIDENKILIRLGLFNVRNLKLANIKSIELNNLYIARCKNVKRYNLAGNPNLVLNLKIPEEGVERIFLGLDQAVLFKNELESIIKPFK